MTTGIFEVAAAASQIQLNADGKGEAVFTVTNRSSGSVRAQIKLRPLEETKSEWLSLAGQAEQDFGPGSLSQVIVRVNAHAPAPAGKYEFRIDVIPIDNPDEDYSEGPVVTLRTGLPARPARPFPWAALLAISAGFVLIAALIYFVIPKKVDVPKVTNMRFAEAEKMIRDAGLTMEKEVREDPSVDDEKVIDQSPKEGTKIRSGGIIKLTVAVPLTFDIPNVAGKTFEEASGEISALGLKVEKVAEEYAGADEDLVVDQEPKEGRLKKGGVIKLTVMVPLPPWGMPDFVGSAKSIKEAEDFLANRFVFVKKEPVENDSEREGNILGQRPDKNEEIEAGGTATLKFAVSTAQFPMPKMIGRPWESASELVNRGLRVDLKGKVDSTQPHEQITEQEPPAGTPIRSGQPVILRVALTTVNVPPVAGRTLQESKALLKEAGLVLAEVRGECTKPVENSDPKPGTSVARSTAVILFTPGDPERVCRKEFLVWSQVLKALLLPKLLEE